MDLVYWLLLVVDLFDMTLDSVLALPVLGFFLYFLLFLTLFHAMAWLISRGMRRRL